MNQNWLENISIGDLVIEDIGSAYTINKIDKVKRLTKTMIILEKSLTRYNRQTGMQVGFGGWHFDGIREATPEKITQIREETRRRTLISRLSSVNWNNLKIKPLEKIWEMIPQENN